jgi:hypothetical protein
MPDRAAHIRAADSNELAAPLYHSRQMKILRIPQTLRRGDPTADKSA